MYIAETSVRVRYAETDQMGYVYYGNYAMYYEVARVEALRQLGVRYKDIEAAGIILPVRENSSQYIRPARYDDLLRIVTTVRQRPATRIRFEYDIFNASEKIHCGATTLVFCDAKTGRPCPVPPFLEALFHCYFP